MFSCRKSICAVLLCLAVLALSGSVAAWAEIPPASGTNTGRSVIDPNG
jgi:hypothetical protein